jgi:hypothetical protein
VLRQARLVETDKRGAFVTYRIADASLEGAMSVPLSDVADELGRLPRARARGLPVVAGGAP